MLDLNTLPFIRCRWYRAANGRHIDYVAVHSMEFYERPDAAEWCANYFATTDRKASTHFTADNDSIIRCAHDHEVCYSANGINHNGLHIEMAGFAGQSAGDWADDYSRRMIVRVAALTAALCARYNVPATFVDAAGLLQGARGITTHREAELAFPYGGHTDPGPNFPMDLFINSVRSQMESQAQLAEWLAAALGEYATVADGPKGKVVMLQLRDLRREKELAALGQWNGQPIFTVAPLGHALSWSHQAASDDNE